MLPASPRFSLATQATPAQLVSALTTSGPCIALKDGLTASGTAAVTATCNATASAQTLTVPPVGTTGEVRVAGTLCLDLVDPLGTNGTSARFVTCAGTASQRWTLTAAGELRGVAGKCLGVEAGSTTPGARLTYWGCLGNDTARQTWSARAVASPTTQSSTVQVVSALTAGGPCLTIKSGVTAPGTTALTATCDLSSYYQSLQLPAVGTTGEVRVAKTLCLDLSTATGADGSYALFDTCDGTAAQKWTFTAAGELRGVADKCLGIEGGSATPGARLTYWRCVDGASKQRWGTRPTSATEPVLPAPTGSPSILVSTIAGNPCLASSDTGGTLPANLTLAVCTRGTAQRFYLPATGVTGPIRFGATMCVDLAHSGVGGGTGDTIRVVKCNGGPSQQWTVTASGQIVGMSSRCPTVANAIVGNILTFWDCSPTAKVWTIQTAGALPTPVPVSSRLTGPTGVLTLMAATRLPSVASQIARGGAWAKYENDFTGNTERLWTYGGTSYEANFYDRAMIYYVWWARTGNATYLDRANQLAVAARTFIESTDYKTFPYQLMPDGVALHALVTGDARSANTIARLADYYAQPGTGWWNILDDSTDSNVDGRTQARILSTVLAAWYLKVPSPGGHDYGVLLRDIVTKILRTQSPTGAYRFRNQCYYNKPYMTGMVNDALIRYYTMFEPDARIPAAVKKAADYIWANNWSSTTGKLEYIDAYCSVSQEGASPTAGLNNMISSGYAFVAKVTGDVSYYTKADAIFTAGVNGVWLTDHKQFNQEYTSSYRFLSLRF